MFVSPVCVAFAVHYQSHKLSPTSSSCQNKHDPHVTTHFLLFCVDFDWIYFGIVNSVSDASEKWEVKKKQLKSIDWRTQNKAGQLVIFYFTFWFWLPTMKRVNWNKMMTTRSVCRASLLCWYILIQVSMCASPCCISVVFLDHHSSGDPDLPQ